MSEQYGMTKKKKEWCGDNYDKVEMVPGQEGSCVGSGHDCEIAYEGWDIHNQGAAPCQSDATPGKVWYLWNKDDSSNVGNCVFEV